MQLDGESAQKAIQAARNYYLQMETLLSNQDCLAGDFSFADIAFYMAALFGERMGATLGDETPLLLQWRDRMTVRSAVQNGVKPLVTDLLNAHRPVPEFLSDVASLCHSSQL
jgi:glutathione S-transferase